MCVCVCVSVCLSGAWHAAGHGAGMISYMLLIEEGKGNPQLVFFFFFFSSSIPTWKIPWTRGAWWATVPGLIRVGHDLATKQQQQQYF